jgi:hypothetical protein
MNLYYFIDSDGEKSNLPLYALKQAKHQWASLQENQTECFHERCVFLICTLGLSVSQLLNLYDQGPSTSIRFPKEIFDSLVKDNHLDATLTDRFEIFNTAYNICRHFGFSKDSIRYYDVNTITFESMQEHYEFGWLVWEVVIMIFRRNPANDLNEFNLSNLAD